MKRILLPGIRASDSFPATKSVVNRLIMLGRGVVRISEHHGSALPSGVTNMSRAIVLFYGIVAYAIGLGGLVAFILFVGGWDFLSPHIDSHSPGPLGLAVAINLGLMILFGLQHSVMARPKFKEAWTKVIPPAAERSTYVLLSGAIFFLICFSWRSIPGTI